MSGSVLILGATSGIARALGRKLAEEGHDLALAARRGEVLENEAHDLNIRFGVKVRCYDFDALDTEGHQAFLDRVVAECGHLAGAVIAFGYMGREEESWRDSGATRLVIDTNLTGALSAILPIATHLEQRNGGFLCAISSVAGDRGRKKNMTYGAAKAGLSVYMQGLLQRFTGTGVKVILVKPGFVDTRMTWPLGKLPMIVPAEKAAGDILKAIRRGKTEIYTPWMWRWIMLIIRNVPTFLFKRMKF